MESVCHILLLVGLFSATTEAASCQEGWVAYKDELCIKSFNSLLTYEEARNFCSAQGSEISKASLVMVKVEELQNLLVDYTQDTYDNLWLGGKHDNQSAEFRWEDGNALTYTNWQEGHPRNESDGDACIEFKPPNAKLSTHSGGQWADVTCRKRNMVICQVVLSWTLQDAIEEIKRIRKQHEEDNAAFTDVTNKLREEIEAVNSRVVPIGSIYIEYYNQPSPLTLWPKLTWEDITSAYAGLFFRAHGNESANWGEVQSEGSPGITAVEWKWSFNSGDFQKLVSVPLNGWSDYVKSADSYNTGDSYYQGQRFNSSGCEVRPRNQAIRFWKRTA